MGIIQNLDINFSAKTRSFNNKVRKSKQEVTSLGDRIRLIGKSAKGFFSSLGGIGRTGFLGLGGAALGATAGMVALGKSQASVIDSVAKQAKVIGESTEAIHALNFAAGQTAGISDIGDSLIEFSKRLGEATLTGTGEAIAGLESLKLNANELDALPLEEKIFAISEAFEGVSSASEKARLADQIFGDSEFVPFLEAGKGALQGYMTEAKKLGLTIDNEQSAKVEAANDALDKMKQSFVGVGRTIAVSFAPFIQKAASFVSEFVVKGRDLFNSWLPSIVTFFATVEFSAINWKKTLTLAATSVALSFVTFVEDIKHFFLTVIPSVFVNFGKATWEFFKNLASNVGSAMQSLWDYILGRSDRLEFVWKPLTTGFKKAMAEVRNNATRERTGVEKALQESLNRQADDFGAGLADHIQSRLALLESKGKEIKQDVFNADTVINKEEEDSTVSSKGESIEAVQKGSFEALKLLENSRNNSRNLELAEAKQQNAKLEELIQVVRKHGLPIAAL